MCIFTGTIHPIVTATKIFITMVSVIHQLTVYENNIRATAQSMDKNGVAMILPVPGNGEITMVDFSGYSSFFSDLEKELPIRNPWEETFSNSLSLRSDPPPKFLKIQRVGAYDVSVAKNLKDLENLNWDHFDLNPQVTQLLHSTYAKNFGFVVARVMLLNELKPHPIGYIHEIPEANRSNLYSSLFVPTMHEGHFSNPSHNKVNWDHSIFLMGDHPENENWKASINASSVRNVNFRKINSIIQGSSSNNYSLINPSVTALKRQVITGVHKNCDLHFKTMTPLKSYFDPQAFTSSFPLMDQINHIHDLVDSTILNETWYKNHDFALRFLLAFLFIFIIFISIKMQ